MSADRRTVGLRAAIGGVAVALACVSCAPAPAGAAQDAQAEAGRILDAAGVAGGLVVHVGCGDGKLTAALRAGESYLVHALDADAANVAAARKHIRSLGLYGAVSVERWTGAGLPYADSLVNLVVAEDPGKIAAGEIMRVLCPHGVAYVKRGGRWTKTVKPRPEAMDEWTHYLHDATNNAVAKDTLVGPPRHMQWVCGPRWARSHDHLSSTSALVSAGGRIFYILDEGPVASVAIGPRWALIARDAFNGVLLWKRRIGPWEGHLRNFRSGPPEIARRLIASGDRVYVTLGYGKGVTALDAATGRDVRTCDGTTGAMEMVLNAGTLFVVVGDRSPDNTGGAAIPNRPEKVWYWWPIYADKPPKKHIVAVRADSGKMLWKKDDADTAEMLPTALAASGGQAFFQSPSELIALEAGSGRVLWRAARPVSRQRPSWTAPTLVVYGDVVLSADRQAAGQPGRVKWTVDSTGGVAPVGEIIAFAADTGRRLWQGPARECYNAPTDVLVAGGLVWTGSLVKSKDPGITVGLDVKTGQVKRRRPKDQGQFTIRMSHHRCYRNKATERYLVLGRDGIEFIDVATGKGQGNAWVRGACQYGVMPCNGLIYAPPHSCACHIESKLNGFNALAPAAEKTREAAKGTRLEKGPAFAKAAAGKPAYGSIRNPQSPIRNVVEDWPTYRHDPARSGFTKTTVPTGLTPKWQVDLGAAGTLSTVTVAEGKLFVASVDDHTVHALDAGSGQRAWSYTAGGRVDSPPTIWRGLAIFGCADGWVYCLNAVDGRLVWRFRGAPVARRVVAYGQLESTWPMHGSVLVAGGVVYAAAGRSAYLDGGVVLHRLDAATGKALSATPLDKAALPDVLSGDGTSVFMRHRRFTMDGDEEPPNVEHLYSSAGFLDGDWWHRTYWQVGKQMQSGWGAWPNVGNRVPAGRLLVLDDSSVYGFGRLNQYHRNGSHVGLGRMHYRLFACARKPKTPAAAAGEAARRRKGPAPSKVTVQWSQRVGLMVRAMVLAGPTLFVAGPPDVLGDGPEDNNHPYAIASRQAIEEQAAAFAGLKGAVLWAVSKADGKKLGELKLPAAPVWDGMVAANGRLYIATKDGKVLCFAGK